MRIKRDVNAEVASLSPAIEREEETVPYASAGQNVNLYLAGIDPIHLSIGAVLCPLSDPVPLATKFTAQILVFDIAFPLIAGVPVGYRGHFLFAG